MAGWIAFAGMLMMIIGGLDIFQGLVAVIRDQYYVQGTNGALVIDVSQWGWVMMICLFGAGMPFHSPPPLRD